MNLKELRQKLQFEKEIIDDISKGNLQGWMQTALPQIYKKREEFLNHHNINKLVNAIIDGSSVLRYTNLRYIEVVEILNDTVKYISDWIVREKLGPKWDILAQQLFDSDIGGEPNLRKMWVACVSLSDPDIRKLKDDRDAIPAMEEIFKSRYNIAYNRAVSLGYVFSQEEQDRLHNESGLTDTDDHEQDILELMFERGIDPEGY